jgi:hypothetical protein
MVKWKMKKNTHTSEAVDHIVCDLQLLMYECSFSFFIWPLHCLWFTAFDVSVFFFIFHLTIALSDNAMVKWKMKKNTDTSKTVNHRQCNGQMKNEKEHWYIKSLWFTASDVSLFFFIFHLTIALSVIYSFWCISVLFHFSFDHCIVCDLQLLMYQCSFSFFIWPLHYIRSCKSQTMQWSNEKWKRTLIHQKL